MEKFTEKELKELGFQKNVVPPEDNDGITGYIYYNFQLDEEDYTIALISDVFENDVKEVTVEFFGSSKPLSRELVKLIIKEFKK